MFITNYEKKSAWHLGYWFNLIQGFVALQFISHIEASGISNKLQMQPFSADAAILGPVGILVTTMQVLAGLHLDLSGNE